MAKLVDARKSLEGFSCSHDPLHYLRVTVLESHRLRQNGNSFFIGVELVGHDGRETICEHSMRVIRIHERVDGTGNFLRLNTHQGSTWPEIGEIAVIRKTAS